MARNQRVFGGSRRTALPDMRDFADQVPKIPQFRLHVQRGAARPIESPAMELETPVLEAKHVALTLDVDERPGESAPLRVALARPAQVAPTTRACCSWARPGLAKALRPGRARTQPAACAPPGTGELRGLTAVARRERALRAREGRVHRRRRRASGAFRGGRRRDDLPGRDRRPDAGHPGEVPASAPRRRIRARGIVPDQEG